MRIGKPLWSEAFRLRGSDERGGCAQKDFICSASGPDKNFSSCARRSTSFRRSNSRARLLALWMTPVESNSRRASPLESNTALKAAPSRGFASPVESEYSTLPRETWTASIVGKTAGPPVRVVGLLPTPLNNAVARKHGECDGDSIFHSTASCLIPIVVPHAIDLSMHMAGIA